MNRTFTVKTMEEIKAENTHIETYWKPEYVEQAVGKLVAFFGKNL